MAFNLRKIFFPTASDLFAPHMDMKRLADSTISIVPVANATERDALKGQASPSAPIYVHQEDTARLLVSVGGAFEVVNPRRAKAEVAMSTNDSAITAIAHGLGAIPTYASAQVVGSSESTAGVQDVARLADPVLWFKDANAIHFRWRRIDTGAWFPAQPVSFVWTAEL